MAIETNQVEGLFSLEHVSKNHVIRNGVTEIIPVVSKRLDFEAYEIPAILADARLVGSCQSPSLPFLTTNRACYTSLAFCLVHRHQ
jgi:hypothetical protein